jgi:hypothetical protein
MSIGSASRVMNLSSRESRVKIVENDVNFLFLAVGVDDAVHEIQELPAPPPFVVTGLDQASSDL